MPPSKSRSLLPILLALVAMVAPLVPSGVFAAESAADLKVTGQHRGYTNDQLFLRLDDDKEMTFIVRIAGDKDEKWHEQFATLSRITVTYHTESGQKYPIATAIEQAPAK